MGRNWFEAYCDKHNKAFLVLIGNPTQCSDCVLEEGEREKLTKIPEVGREGGNTVIMKPGGEKEV